MEQIFTDVSASITELKKNPTGLLAQADGQAIAILNRNTPTAYLVPPAMFEQFLEALDDKKLVEIVQTRQHDIANAVEIALDDL